MTAVDRLDTINTALMRAHCLSKAVFLILTNEDAENIENPSTFRAAIEEVNECAHEAIQIAIDQAAELVDGTCGTGGTMSAPFEVPAGISEARSQAVQSAATSLAQALDALVATGGMVENDTIPAVTVRWFADKMREDVAACLRAVDQCESEPELEIRP